MDLDSKVKEGQARGRAAPRRRADGSCRAARRGVIMFATGQRALALLALVAAYAIVGGATLIAATLELRGVAAEVKRRLRPPPTANPLMQV